MGLNYNGYASSLADKYLIRVEVCDSGKYSSLLQYGETIDVKKFYSAGPSDREISFITLMPAS